MQDKANDRREGYADGMAERECQYRNLAYQGAWGDGFTDKQMLDAIAEQKRRAALPRLARSPIQIYNELQRKMDAELSIASERAALAPQPGKR